MNLPSWFNTVLGVIVGITQVPALNAALGPYAYILAAIGVLGNLYFHNAPTGGPSPKAGDSSKAP